MKIILSLVLVFGGWVLYFALTFAGFYRLYPIESIALMVIAIWLAWSAARGKGGWWRYAACGLVSLLSVIFVYWTVSVIFVYWTVVFSQLPDQQLSVSVDEKLFPITLTDHNGNTFHSPDLKGNSAALYLFYRGEW
jgi:hypothetical protein